MSILEAVVLGLVQGLTEFLPISSTAHLRIVPALVGWPDPGAAYSALIQCGTLVAVVVAMWDDVRALVRGFVAGLATGRPWATLESRVAVMILIGTLPIVAVGLAARDFIRGDARDLAVVACALGGATILMAAAEIVRHRRTGRGRDGLDGVRLPDALWMGCAQVLALLPGASRSGTTISTGMLTGLDRRTAARFSFLLSLPAIAAAATLEAWQARREILASREDVVAVVVGTVVAAVAGYASIRWLLGMLATRTLWPFVAYRLGLVGLLAALLAGGWETARSVPLRTSGTAVPFNSP